MTTSRERLSYLFNCYYNKTATLQEREELFAVITAGTKDAEISNLIRRAWDNLHLDTPIFNTSKTDLMLSSILAAGHNQTETKANKPRKNLFLWASFTYAALVLLFIGVGFYFYTHRANSNPKKQIVKIKKQLNDALPGSSKAVLTLANGQTIILDNAQNGTLAKQGTTLIHKTTKGQLVYNAANLTHANIPPSINTIATPRGGEYQVILPDGTKVWLNAVSSIRFPTRFSGSLREVEITGEAYFEVTKNTSMPFRVKTSRAEIEVLGTHFNVMAYAEENLMKTTLLEGSVNIKSGSTVNRLKPGQQAQINAAGLTKVVNDIDADDEVAWKNGIFQFRDAGIEVILRQASRWYDVDVVYSGKIPKKEFTGRLSRNVKASELLNMLNYTGVNLHIENKNIIVD